MALDGSSAYGRFGLSVANLGDINGDGHEGAYLYKFHACMTFKYVVHYMIQ